MASVALFLGTTAVLAQDTPVDDNASHATTTWIQGHATFNEALEQAMEKPDFTVPGIWKFFTHLFAREKVAKARHLTLGELIQQYALWAQKHQPYQGRPAFMRSVNELETRLTRLRAKLCGKKSGFSDLCLNLAKKCGEPESKNRGSGVPTKNVMNDLQLALGRSKMLDPHHLMHGRSDLDFFVDILTAYGEARSLRCRLVERQSASYEPDLDVCVRANMAVVMEHIHNRAAVNHDQQGRTDFEQALANPSGTSAYFSSWNPYDPNSACLIAGYALTPAGKKIPLDETALRHALMAFIDVNSKHYQGAGADALYYMTAAAWNDRRPGEWTDNVEPIGDRIIVVSPPPLLVGKRAVVIGALSTFADGGRHVLLKNKAKDAP